MTFTKTSTDEDRFLAKVDRSGLCWLWTAYTNPRGYGQFGIGSRTDGTAKVIPAHRWAYEHWVGPIPDGLTIDHLCRNRPCVNPDHLEPVTQGENTLRGDTFQAENLAKTHCPQGHPYDEANTYRYSDGKRACRECRREHRRRYKRRRRMEGRG